ncbi:MAG: hypothetical protein IBJ18_00240 [Phycisphaerales bacterium]|nr:hypothetical protein [Phycisphaerales bacterium]
MGTARLITVLVCVLVLAISLPMLILGYSRYSSLTDKERSVSSIRGNYDLSAAGKYTVYIDRPYHHSDFEALGYVPPQGVTKQEAEALVAASEIRFSLPSSWRGDEFVPINDDEPHLQLDRRVAVGNANPAELIVHVNTPIARPGFVLTSRPTLQFPQVIGSYLSAWIHGSISAGALTILALLALERAFSRKAKPAMDSTPT